MGVVGIEGDLNPLSERTVLSRNEAQLRQIYSILHRWSLHGPRTVQNRVVSKQPGEVYLQIVLHQK